MNNVYAYGGILNACIGSFLFILGCVFISKHEKLLGRAAMVLGIVNVIAGISQTIRGIL